MSFDVILLYLLAIVGASATWLLPKAQAMDGFAAFTLLVLAWFSWPTALWLLLAILLTWAALRIGQHGASRNLAAAALALALLAAFVAAQFTHGVLWLGASFFTLRLLHVAGEWWTGRMAAPTLPALLRYQLFLPVLVIGPIHRMPHFERQVTRRRWDSSAWFTGLERCLVGFVMAHFLGDVVTANIALRADLLIQDWPEFGRTWALSAIGWVRLFFIFAGLSAVALGASLMAGLALEENFNKPWRATSLLDFWNRWHMSLTSWSRDYAYKPVMAVTRSPVAGLVAAMLVIGLWHDLSVYYVCWSFWQALGIMVSRQLGRFAPVAALPKSLAAVVIPLAILAWLSAARPVISLLLGVDHDPANALF